MSGPRWAVVGDCAAGTSHASEGAECQDAMRWEVFGECVVLAVADGAGSAAFGGVGAEIVCDEVIRIAEMMGPTPSWTSFVRIAFASARSNLVSEAESRGVPLREFACTALLAVVTPGGAAFGQIGDGAIVVRRDGVFDVVFWPEPAEYANATEFLTDEDFAETLRMSFDPPPPDEDSLKISFTPSPPDAVALFTDGLQRLALDFAARQPHAPFFRPFFRELAAADDPATLQDHLRGFLNSPAVSARTDDDKTLLLAVRRP